MLSLLEIKAANAICLSFHELIYLMLNIAIIKVVN